MNKHIKRLIITVGTVFTLLGLGGTIAYASGYIAWEGTGDYETALNNLKAIDTYIGDLNHELGLSDHTVDELKVIIQQKEQITLTLEKEIEDLKDSGSNNNSQLEQAVKDMENVKEETEELLNKHQ